MAIEPELIQKVTEFRDTSFFKAILKEWALHVKAAEEPAVFANMYMEWMRDPDDAEARGMVSTFANFMRVSDWDGVLAMIAPVLGKDDLEIFQRPIARKYFADWSGMVFEQIREYWEKFLQDRAKIRAIPFEPAPKENPSPDAAPKLQIGATYKVELNGGLWNGEFTSKLMSIETHGRRDLLIFENGVRMTPSLACDFTKVDDGPQGSAVSAP